MTGMHFFLSDLYLEERYFMKKKLSCFAISYQESYFPASIPRNQKADAYNGTTTVERSFSQVNIIKTRLRNSPEMKLVDFDEVLDLFREKIGVSVYKLCSCHNRSHN
ncbi:hypothetical protein LOD99_6751 [Oopsacas minuta]|uniref:HAT C-terminal dimerisation domain-containing protein n=1 Tax=Oopsacas minuta TaxID=111878 RepID=A0AAV7JMF7_9METZ|nr:hypothetical protein LOD99_6751 [Oopsacas minuta]